jgi:UDPglucose--hexose-1-phosphate uridylyltransferase
VSELRWNPLLGEWVVTAARRQDRTYFPPVEFCPLCPTTDPNHPTEVPEPTFDIVSFENRFPSFETHPEAPAVLGSKLYPVRPSQGVCEVVVYTPRHNSTLAQEPVAQIEQLIRVWTDRFAELGALEFVKYVFIFENKGAAIGVTLSHPHGQIYAYPFVPPLIGRELAESHSHRVRTTQCLLCNIVAEELSVGARIVTENESFVAYVPFFARWPYEVHITSKRHLQALTDLTIAERLNLARILKVVLVAFDRLFNVSLPYMMVLHQRPTDGNSYDDYHFHIEFYTPLRTANKLKYLAGSESGAGTFINDRLAEESASELCSHAAQVLADLKRTQELD